MTWETYEQDLNRRIEDLHARVTSGAYRAQPSRRSYIPKEDGSKRPLAVAALEDKIVQRATAAVLSVIYEEDFLGFCVLQRQKKGDGKKSRKAAWKMREGPSRSAFRSRSQTTPSRCG
jgi:RNA-directed DNA polymerase